MPIVNATLGVLLGRFAGLSIGGAAILGTMAASASYIAAPPAVRLTLPDANPTCAAGVPCLQSDANVRGLHMKNLSCAVLLAASTIGLLHAQDSKPVPKNSVRIFVPGCGRGYVFTAGRPAEDVPGGSAVPEGTRMRMAGPRKLLREIEAQEGNRIEITGLIKKGQDLGRGVPLGGGARITGGGPPVAGGGSGFGTVAPVEQLVIDVEGWRPLPGNCPTR